MINLVSKLVNGQIPAGTVCPFKDKCQCDKLSEDHPAHCGHHGVNHTVDYSCAWARGWELVERYAGVDNHFH